MIKLQDILQEIGEGSAKPYPYKLHRNSFTKLIDKNNGNVLSAMDNEDSFGQSYTQIKYTFKTDKGVSYVVMFDYFIDNDGWIEAVIAFTANGSYGDVINKGEVFRVMATIVDIVKENHKHYPAENYEMEPTKDNFNEKGSRRERMYLMYIKKTMPSTWYVTTLQRNDDDIIRIETDYEYER